MDFESIPNELREKAKAAKSPEAILALAKQGGYELSTEELEAISGGASWSCTADCSDHTPCPSNR